MDDIKDLHMPDIFADDKHIVLEQTHGLFTICGRQSHFPNGVLPEVVMMESLIPGGSIAGPASLVAVKRRYVLYRQIYTPTTMQGRAQPNAPFNKSQR